MRLLSTKLSDASFSFGMLILRVGSGLLLLINHGYPKLVDFSEKSATFNDPLNLGSSTSLALTVFAEAFCALFIILGLFTRLAALPVVILFGVILFKISKNISAGPGGGALAALFFVAFSAILIMGPGRYSIDKKILRK